MLHDGVIYVYDARASQALRTEVWLHAYSTIPFIVGGNTVVRRYDENDLCLASYLTAEKFELMPGELAVMRNYTPEPADMGGMADLWTAMKFSSQECLCETLLNAEQALDRAPIFDPVLEHARAVARNKIHSALVAACRLADLLTDVDVSRIYCPRPTEPNSSSASLLDPPSPSMPLSTPPFLTKPPPSWGAAP